MTSPSLKDDEIEKLFKTFDEKFDEIEQKISSLEKDLKTVPLPQDQES